MKNGVKTADDLRRYVAFRLGADPRRQLANMFKRAFTASTFQGFWLYWNPVYNFYLSRYVYRPLRRILSKKPAAILTFMICGFVLHDLPVMILTFILAGIILPIPVTITFGLLGALSVLAGSFGLSLAKLPDYVRVLVHMVTIVAAFITAIEIGRFF